MYDSEKDTLKHIERVREYLNNFIGMLTIRAVHHDESKLASPEKGFYDKYTPLLSNTTYGSNEYKLLLKNLGPALQHHYKNNSHHPEYYKAGINEMTLIDIVEMLCDWKAASERHNNGDIRKSLEINRDRFYISGQLYSILENTIDVMGW